LAQAQYAEAVREQEQMEEEQAEQAEQAEADERAQRDAQRDQEDAAALASIVGTLQQMSQPRAVYTRPTPTAPAPRATYTPVSIPIPQVVQAPPAAPLVTTVASSDSGASHAGESANGCVALDNSQVYTGGISTDSAGVINKCGYKVSYTYCIRSGNGGGVFSCQGGNGNLDFIAAYGRSVISIMGASSPFEVKIEVCRDPSTPSNGLANGQSVSCVRY
jgi:hypothetical protein